MQLFRLAQRGRWVTDGSLHRRIICDCNGTGTSLTYPEPWGLKLAQTVLVVEDELLIRLEIADYLEGCGYTVLQEPSAADAIVLIRKRPDIDLVSRMSERRARWME